MSGDFGMSGFMSAITDSSTGITVDSVWGAITPLVPLLVTGLVVGIGFGIFKKVYKGLGNRKTKC